MNKVFLSFEAENNEELVRLVLSYAARQSRPPSWLGETPPPIDPQLQEDAATLTDEDYDARHSPPVPATPLPAEPEPAKTRKPRAPRVAAAVAPTPAPEPDPSPAPVSADLPALETLKQLVTTHVRLAQKGEGSNKILDLLPKFKDTTGLDFVMNAGEKHRPALYELVVTAGIPVV